MPSTVNPGENGWRSTWGTLTPFSVLYWAFLCISSIVLFFVALVIWSVTAPFDATRSLLHRYTCWWALLYLRCLPGCRIQIEGAEKIAPGTAYVLVTNHQSTADIMALSALSVRFKWVSKRENFRLPFIGWNMYLNGYVKVARGNRESARKTMEYCQMWVRRGVSTLWFPEGHRSPTGELQQFHSGAFRLAAKCGCPIVPIIIDGMPAVYRGWRVSAYPGQLLIRVLDPVTAAETGGNADQLRDHVWKRMKQELMEIRGQQGR